MRRCGRMSGPEQAKENICKYNLKKKNLESNRKEYKKRIYPKEKLSKEKLYFSFDAEKNTAFYQMSGPERARERIHQYNKERKRRESNKD